MAIVDDDSASTPSCARRHALDQTKPRGVAMAAMAAEAVTRALVGHTVRRGRARPDPGDAQALPGQSDHRANIPALSIRARCATASLNEFTRRGRSDSRPAGGTPGLPDNQPRAARALRRGEVLYG